MKISIITVVYNGAKTIRDTIESVLAQDYTQLEYIIIDGNSQDETISIIESYGNKIHHFVTEPDLGIYDAMNKGISIATGEIIGLLNADDIFPNSKVLTTVAEKFKQDKVDAVYGDIVYVDSENLDSIKRSWKAGVYRDGMFLWGWMPPHPSFFIRKNWYINYGKFRLDLRTAADYELMLRMIHKHKASLAYIPETLVKMRVGGASNQTLRSRIIANHNDRRAWELNGLRPFIFTTTLKPLRKVLQFI